MPVRAHEASEYLGTPEESDGGPRLLMKAFATSRRPKGCSPAACRETGDPDWGTVTKIAAACGVSLRFVQREGAE